MTLALRIAAGLVAIFWAVLFFGVIDLWVIADPGVFAPVVALEASWGALFTFFVAGAFAALAWRPRVVVPPAVQLLVVAVALLAGSLGGRDAGPLPVALVLAVAAALLLALNRTPRSELITWSVRRPTLITAVVAAPFWLVYAGNAFANSRSDTVEDDVTWGISHWPVQGATALTIAGAALLASVWPPGRRLLAASTSLAGTCLGAASLAYPASSGAMPGGAWSFAAVLWGVTLGLLAAPWRP